MTTERNYVQRVAAEVRAELARQDKTIDDLAATLNMKAKATARLRFDGTTAYDLEELWTIASWLGVDVCNFTTVTPGRAAA